jgi:hypothetical protein
VAQTYLRLRDAMDARREGVRRMREESASCDARHVRNVTR